jgi:hypothetical protein
MKHLEATVGHAGILRQNALGERPGYSCRAMLHCAFRKRSGASRVVAGVAAAFLLVPQSIALAAPAAAAPASVPWWAWPIALFAVTLALGVVAVLTGVGGGVLFVPIVGAFFPFHLDFVRGAGLLLALSGALSAAPALLSNGLASLRLAMPAALIGSMTSIVGALLGLALPTSVVYTALGLTILAVALLMGRARKSDHPEVPASDALGSALRLHGVYHDAASGRDVEWKVWRTPAGLAAFAGIGVIAGMFGLGAGWANVPVFNLLMGVPLKLSVGTSGLLLSVIDSSAAWIYFHRGAVLPMLVAPSIIGVMLGAKIGARLLRVAPAATVRKLVLVLLAFAGARSLLKGLGIWP